MVQSDAARRWADRLERFQSSGLTVAEFCQAEGVSQPSYYHWRRKLLGPAKVVKPDKQSAFLPLRLAEARPQPAIPAAQPATDAHATIELPGGVRICVEVTSHRQLEPAEGSQR